MTQTYIITIFTKDGSIHVLPPLQADTRSGAEHIERIRQDGYTMERGQSTTWYAPHNISTIHVERAVEDGR